ncbi:sensor histidine kinase [Microseira wollei]|uniref:histidine kinase n=1 Tax=Microseira wollei NIES-4236 TaxID=2530354 RepID=A0AAV3XJD1_9CYAN|nr:ATP-binding protein [Microseira wollei]GET41698.1 Chase sensor signal transduction histidine kinase [Microseira wollei NIES-4236]
MKWSLEGKWITGGFSLALVLMGAVSFISYQNATQLAESAKQVRQTNQVLKVITDISATLTDAESGRRGYILFGDPEELERYNKAVASLKQQIDNLRQPLNDTPIQRQRLDILESLISQRLELFQTFIDQYQKAPGRFSPQDPLIVQTKRNQDEIRRVIQDLVSEEEELLEVQVEQSPANFQFRMWLESLGTLLTFVILFGVYALLYRQMVKRQQAETLQRALAQEKELSELKLQFFSMVSHEFRTPLSLIVGSAQLLGESLKSVVEPAKLKNLYRIQSSAKVMTQLLRDVLTLARADAGKLECNPSLVEMQTFCLNLVEDFQVFSESKRTIKFIKQGSCTHAYLDEKLLYSILSNLLDNAIKYSAPESTVYFTLICEPDAVTFQIRDEGIGIAQKEQQKLYDPFSRGKNAREIMGTGLGLAVVKKCLDLHRGEISVESEVGIGTTFTVRIPPGKENRG